MKITKSVMFLDIDEQKEVQELVSSLKKKKNLGNGNWISSGSMLVMYDVALDSYEIYLFRGQVKVKN